MTFLDMLLVGIGLSMDAVAVTIANGMAYRCKAREKVAMPLLFGGFQGLMPLLGYLLGVNFQNTITSVEHWIGGRTVCQFDLSLRGHCHAGCAGLYWR